LTGIDLNAGLEIFESSEDLTVGLEEEFAILDPTTLDLAPRYEELRAASAGDDELERALAGELISSEIEIVSGRGSDLQAALAAQAKHRRGLFALAAANGAKLGATGTHPWADYRVQRIIETEHYRRVADGLQYVARRNNTFSLHAHVGVNGADRAVKVCDRLRPVLPVLLAISANSPFLEGQDAGLASTRSQTFTRSFPRCGIPDTYGDWDKFADYISFLVASKSIVEYTQVWWSVRPHLTFGTVEVRICDVQATAAESDALASLIVACVAQAMRDIDDGRITPEVPSRLIEENMWRAIRYGLDGELLNLPSAESQPARKALERLLAWTAPVRAELGISPDFPAANGAQRQRALLNEGLSLHDVFASTVSETRDSYAAGYERA
jgi:carboxylate-amine ligase